MSKLNRLIPGSPFPDIVLLATDGSNIALAEKGWRALFVIRGAHCQICSAYLGKIEEKRLAWEAKGIDVLVASADPLEKSREFMAKAGFRGRAAWGMDVPAMRALGLWMTGPDISNLDYVHPEPGFFLIDPDGNVAASETSTLPAVRPDLEWLDRGFTYIVENDVRPRFGLYGSSTSSPLKRKGETVFLTGATGYIGSVVAERLQAAGYIVRGLTRSKSKVPLLEKKGILPIVGDVNDVDLIAKGAMGVSAIVHTASPNAPLEGMSMEKMVADAVHAIEQLAKLAAKNSARLLITSGASLYGPTDGQIVNEASPLRVPPFAIPLAKAETELSENGRAYILRSGGVYGRNQSAPMRTLIEEIRKRGKPAIVDPTNRLSLVHVDDLADLYIAILETESPPAIVNGVASILAWPEVIGAVAKAAGISSTPETITPDQAAALGGPAIYMAVDMAVSGELARESLKWQPKAPSFEVDLSPAN